MDSHHSIPFMYANKMDVGFTAGIAFMGSVTSIFIVLVLCRHGEGSNNCHRVAKAASAQVVDGTVKVSHGSDSHYPLRVGDAIVIAGLLPSWWRVSFLYCSKINTLTLWEISSFIHVWLVSKLKARSMFVHGSMGHQHGTWIYLSPSLGDGRVDWCPFFHIFHFLF